MTEPLTLDRLPVGESRVVAAVGIPSGDRLVRCRLLEMGLLPGTEVRVVRRAPLGDPIELRLRGYALSLRREEAAAVSLRPTDRAEP